MLSSEDFNALKDQEQNEVEESSKLPVDELSYKEEDYLIKQQQKRDEEVKQTYHKVFILVVKVTSFIFILLILVRTYHYIVPKQLVCYYLSDIQLLEIDKAISYLVSGGLAVRYLKRYREEESK